jgi:unsaturated rhamnogalacturonyl hydrolase
VSGLFAHSYSEVSRSTNGVHWSRGCGWAALGLAETLRWLPGDHPGTPLITAALVHLATTLRACQAGDGHWHVVADVPTTPTEASASALIAEAVSVGLEVGALDGTFQPMRDHAWDALAGSVQDGVVLNVSERQPVSRDPAYYTSRQIGGSYPWGQGPWLLIASRMFSRNR